MSINPTEDPMNHSKCQGHATGYAYDTHVCTDLCTDNECCKPAGEVAR